MTRLEKAVAGWIALLVVASSAIIWWTIHQERNKPIEEVLCVTPTGHKRVPCR